MNKGTVLCTSIALCVAATCVRADQRDAASPAAMNNYETRLCVATERNPRYGEGAAVVLRNGDVLLAYGEFYTATRDDYGAAHVLGRVSSDQGRSWGEPFVLVENDALTTFSASLVRLPSGTILLGYLRKQPAGSAGISAGANCIPWFRSSNDEGRTWSKPWRMDAVLEDEYLNINNDRLIVHSSGRLIAPVAPMKPRPGDPYHCTSLSFYSDDEGKTWQRSTTELTLSAIDGLQEPAVVELKDGKVLMLMRTSLGHQYRSISSDRGATWSAPAPVPEMISPVSPVSVKRLPSTGDLMALFNKTYDPVGSPGPCAMGIRTPLTAMVSQDDGASWTILRNVETDPTRNFDYVSITFLEDEEVLLTYHDTEFFGGPGQWLRHLKLKILPERWFYGSDSHGATSAHK